MVLAEGLHLPAAREQTTKPAAPSAANAATAAVRRLVEGARRRAEGEEEEGWERSLENSWLKDDFVLHPMPLWVQHQSFFSGDHHSSQFNDPAWQSKTSEGSGAGLGVVVVVSVCVFVMVIVVVFVLVEVTSFGRGVVVDVSVLVVVTVSVSVLVVVTVIVEVLVVLVCVMVVVFVTVCVDVLVSVGGRVVVVGKTFFGQPRPSDKQQYSRFAGDQWSLQFRMPSWQSNVVGIVVVVVRVLVVKVFVVLIVRVVVVIKPLGHP